MPTINQLIRWIYEYNFISGDMPVFEMWEEEDVDKGLAERDEILSRTGIKFTKTYYKKSYGFEDDDIEIAQPETKPTDFSEFAAKTSILNNQEVLDELAEKFTPDVLQSQCQDILKPVLKQVRSYVCLNF